MDEVTRARMELERAAQRGLLDEVGEAQLRLQLAQQRQEEQARQRRQAQLQAEEQARQTQRDEERRKRNEENERKMRGQARLIFFAGNPDASEADFEQFYPKWKADEQMRLAQFAQAKTRYDFGL